jgi:hypothetical protein
MDEDRTTTNDWHARFDDMARAFAIAAAILAYCLSPLLAFVDPATFWTAGAGFAGGVMGLYGNLRSSRRELAVTLLFGGLAVLGLGQMMYCLINAAEITSKNDDRCRALENDMLSLKPKRANGPEIYQALKCRPLTSNRVEFGAANQNDRPASR